MESLNIGLDLIAKSTALLMLAAVACFLLRKQPAALRHRIWGLSFCGLILLPWLTLMLPTWQLPILPAHDAKRQTEIAVADSQETQSVIPERTLPVDAFNGHSIEPPLPHSEEPVLNLPPVPHAAAEIPAEKPVNTATDERDDLSWSMVLVVI